MPFLPGSPEQVRKNLPPLLFYLDHPPDIMACPAFRADEDAPEMWMTFGNAD
jgi:hypothetical protein